MFDTLKDMSVVYSFDESGYLRHAKDFRPVDPERVKGRHYLITGGTSGIGEALALRLLEGGAAVTVTGRNADKFENSSLKTQGATFLELDMTDFEAVCHAALPEMDGLVCNAGGMPDKPIVVDSRYESIFASQVIGHFLLVRRVTQDGVLAKGKPIHITSSGGMYLVRLDLSDLCFEKRDYDKVAAYANAKRAQVILNEMLAERLSDWHFSASHPGWVGTDALKEAMPSFVEKFGDRLRSAEQGADTMYWCLAQYKDLPTGKFWFDREVRWRYPFFWTREKARARDALWSLCDEAWSRYQKKGADLKRAS